MLTFVNALKVAFALITNSFWTIFKAVTLLSKIESSRFKNDPYLKHLKNWVINNGYYVDSATAEEETLVEKK